jgi:hypothetical protein
VRCNRPFRRRSCETNGLSLSSSIVSFT